MQQFMPPFFASVRAVLLLCPTTLHEFGEFDEECRPPACCIPIRRTPAVGQQLGQIEGFFVDFACHLHRVSMSWICPPGTSLCLAYFVEITVQRPSQAETLATEAPART